MKRSRAGIVAAIVMATLIGACARQVSPGALGSETPQENCLAGCKKEYKECAYGSTCMMTQECILEICMPAQQTCEAQCAAGE